jgi:hypothetical protein
MEQGAIKAGFVRKGLDNGLCCLLYSVSCLPLLILGTLNEVPVVDPEALEGSPVEGRTLDTLGTCF